MFNIFEEDDFIQFKISTDMRHISTVMQQVRKFLRRCNVQDDNPVLILKELISNAFEHGNRNAENSSIMISVEHTGNADFKIMVEDEGKGFDYKNAERKAESDPRTRNQGLELVRNLSERIEFSGRGNCVSVWVKISENTAFTVSSHVSEQGETWTVIQPAASLTAGNAPKFRNVLLDLLSRECRYYRFDLAKVEDMDSVSLSILIKFSNLLRDRHPEAQPEIVNASPDIVNLIRMTCLHRIYRVVQ